LAGVVGLYRDVERNVRKVERERVSVK